MDPTNPAPPRRRRAHLAAVTVAAALTLAATALAGVKSGTYTGTLAPPRTTFLVTLTTHGSALKSATLSNIPIYCSGGGPPIPVHFGAAKVSSSGRFTAHASRRITVGPFKGKIGNRLTLSGRFTAHSTVAGTLRTVDPITPNCGGTSRFSAKR